MRAALIQLTSTRDIDDNLKRCRRFAREAKETGADWILFPENAPFLGHDREKCAIAESLDGQMVAEFRELARDLDAWITLGSFPEISPDPDRTFNTEVHLDPKGSVVDVYRKIHLFDVSIDAAVNFCESDSVHPGTEVVATHVGEDKYRVGLTICYDLRFPELYRALQSKAVEAITVPSAFTLATGHAHWHALLKARAIENQAYLLAPNQWGHHFGTRRSFGQSTIYDPWGRCICCASDREGFVVAELDFNYVAEIRQSMPVLSHRRVNLTIDTNDQ